MNSMLIKQVTVMPDNVIQDILITNGTIAAIESCIKQHDAPTSMPVLDGTGMLALPGMIDMHTHIRDLGLAYKEDFLTASMAAAKGGVTTFFDMPNSVPITANDAALQEKKHAAQKSLLDYGFHFGAIADDNSSDIQACAATGHALPASVKVYLNDTTGSLYITDPDVIENIVAAAWCITAHAEEEQIPFIISLAQKHKKPLYLCHISRASELRCIKEYKESLSQDDTPIYVEVTPHHLAFTKKDSIHTPLLTMKPPLQTQHDVQALWDGIATGLIDTIGTDHAPHTLLEKHKAITQGTHIYGVPGLETAVPFLLDAASKGYLTLKQITNMYSKTPARIFGIPNKGSLAPGYDADITIVNTNTSTIPNNNDVLSKCAWTLFENLALHGTVEATISRGFPVYVSHSMHRTITHIDHISPLRSISTGIILFHKGQEVSCYAHQ